jgi:hypothetical protein
MIRSAVLGLKLRAPTPTEDGHGNGSGGGRERLTERELQILDHLEKAQGLDVPLTEYASAYGLDVKDLYNGKAQLVKLSAKGVKPVIAQAYGLKCRSLVGRFLFDKVMFHACPGCRSKHFLPADDSAADLRTGHLELHAGIGATFNVLDV